jgi:hypothetical protein
MILNLQNIHVITRSNKSLYMKEKQVLKNTLIYMVTDA